MTIYQTYTVVPGDTLGKIARRFNTRMATLCALNAISDPDNIQVGRALRIRVLSENNNTAVPGTSTADNRALLKRAHKFLTDAEVHRLVKSYGDREAYDNFRKGRRVVIGLRNPTDARRYVRGCFDDSMIVAWRKRDGAVVLKRFMGNTEPARIYAWGHARADRGSSVDFDGDGRNDLGRLCAGTYHYSPRAEGHFLGHRAFRARDIQVVMRDVNQDGRFSLADGDLLDPKGAGRSILFHRGGRGHNSWSAGCQTIGAQSYDAFLAALGGQAGFSYILVNVE